jgi:hypothetical protein
MIAKGRDCVRRDDGCRASIFCGVFRDDVCLFTREAPHVIFRTCVRQSFHPTQLLAGKVSNRKPVFRKISARRGDARTSLVVSDGHPSV